MSHRHKRRNENRVLYGLIAVFVVLAVAVVAVNLSKKKQAAGAETSGQSAYSQQGTESAGNSGEVDIQTGDDTQSVADSPADAQDATDMDSADAGDSADSTQEGDKTDSEGQKAVAADMADNASQSDQTIQLTKQQKFSGDLILVNYAEYYLFDQNTDNDLVQISDKNDGAYQTSEDDMQLCAHIMDPLNQMIADCDAAVGGTGKTGVASAFRTEKYQQNMYTQYEKEYGADYAAAYVASPRYSEHHTGLALDMTIFLEDGTEGSFSESENAKWMEENSYRYGFVRRYAEDKRDITHISNEAWHFRYVGIPHAYYMKTNNLCLEEYLEKLKTDTSAASPLAIDVDGTSYTVYYTAEKEETIPAGYNYMVSGNNVDGYIITLSEQ